MAFTAKLDSIQASPERSKLLQKERFDIRKQIERLEQEANRMETNLSFFARSKGADSLRAEVDKKIKDIQQQVSKLKTRLKQLPNE
jgi:archaellum component FlaC